MTTQRIAELEAEVMRLREALRAIIQYTPSGTVACRGDKCREPWCISCNDENDAEIYVQKIFDDVHSASTILSTPFTTTTIASLVEEVERRTIERCIGRVQGFHYLSANFKALEEELQSLPIGQIKLEELL